MFFCATRNLLVMCELARCLGIFEGGASRGSAAHSRSLRCGLGPISKNSAGTRRAISGREFSGLFEQDVDEGAKLQVGRGAGVAVHAGLPGIRQWYPDSGVTLPRNSQ